MAASSSNLPLLLPGLLRASDRAARATLLLAGSDSHRDRQASLSLLSSGSGDSKRGRNLRSSWLLEKMRLPTQAQHHCHPVHAGRFPDNDRPCPTDQKLPGSKQPEPGTEPCKRGMTKIALAPISQRPREQAGACSKAILELN